MDFSSFLEWVVREVEKRAGDDFKDAAIEVSEVKKIGKVYTGLSLRREGDVYNPTVDLNDFYERYLSGMDREIIAEAIMLMLEHRPESLPDMDWISNYDEAKKNLAIVAMNEDQNREFLSDIPYIAREDMAIICYLIYDLPDEGKIGTAVTNSMLREYGIEKLKLFEDAIMNSEELLPAELTFVSDYIGAEECDKGNPYSRLMMLSNTCHFRGAACLFYHGMMERIAAAVGGSYYILPSSVHEMLILPADENIRAADLLLMVIEANLTCVPMEDWLAESVYLYDHSMGKMVRAAGDGPTDLQ